MTTKLRDEQKSCTCQTCSNACSYKPGWFLPGEAEKAAALMKMTLPEFFKKYLGVDWWNGKEFGEETFVLAPVLKGYSAGAEYPAMPKGECVFFNKDKQCGIHAAKPHECQQYWHGDDTARERHEAVAMAWTDHQGQITELLGRKPIAAEPDVGDMFSMFSGMFG
jgi:Fe-S-cluster containining protein